MSEETLHRRRFTLDSLDGIVFDLDENDKSYEVLDGLKFNPNQPRVASGPQGGQWTAGSWSAAVTAAPKELHDAAGNPIPGNIGKLSKVDTSKWDANKPGSKAALKKIALYEKLAAAGSWGELAAAKESLKVSGSPNTYQKTTIKALDTLLEASKLKSVNEIPEKAEVTKEDTAVLSTKGWVQISGKLGTEEGGKFKGPDGKEYYVKTPTNPARAHNEVLASKLYEAFGAQAIKCHLVDLNGKTAVASEWAKESVVPKWENPNVKADAARDYAVHALLGNWGVIGHPSQPDNCKYINGKLTLVDAGGSLEFKASGGSGKKPYGPDLKDYDTLRNHVYNTMGGAVFGEMTKQQHIETMGRVVNSGMTPKKIQDLVDKYHGGTEAEKKALGKTIATRMELMKEKYEKAVLEEKATKAAVEAYQAQIAGSSPDQKSKLELPGKSPDAIPNVSMPPKPVNLASMHPANQKLINKVAEAAIQWSADSTSVMEVFNSEITKVNDEYGTSTPGGFTEFAAVSKFVVESANAMKATQEAFFAEVNKGTSEVSKKQQEVAAKQLSAQKAAAAKAKSKTEFKLTMTEWSSFRNSLTETLKLSDSYLASLPATDTDKIKKAKEQKKQLETVLDLLKKENYSELVDLHASGKIKHTAAGWLSQIVSAAQTNATKKEFSAKGAGESYKSTSEKVATKCNKIKATAKDKAITGAPVLERVGYWNVISNKQNSEFLEKNGFNTENLEKVTENSDFIKLDSSYGPTPMKPLETALENSLDFFQKAYISKYTGHFYEKYNRALRNNSPNTDSPMYKEAVLVAKTVMEKSIDLPVGMKLSRKYSGDVPEVGSVVADRGNLSTSYDPKKWHGNVHMRLAVGPGVKGCPVDTVSSNMGEREVILPPNTRLYITKVTKPTKQQEYLNIPTVVEAVILPTTSDQCCPP